MLGGFSCVGTLDYKLPYGVIPDEDESRVYSISFRVSVGGYSVTAMCKQSCPQRVQLMALVPGVGSYGDIQPVE